MKIRRIAAYRVELPLHEGSYKWSGGKSVGVFDSTLVRVETDSGLVGHGEVCPLGPFYLPAYAEGVRAGPRRARAAPDRRGPARARAAQPPDGRGPQGPSLRQVGDRHRLLGHPRPGGRACRSRPCWAGATARTSSSTARSRRSRRTQMAAKVAGYRAEGYRRFQLKVGGDPGRRHRADPRGARGARSRATVLVADANTGWLLHEAARVVRAVRDVDVYIEQPCADATRSACRSAGAPTIRSSSTRRSTASTSCCARHGDLAMDVVNLKISKLGGLTQRAAGPRPVRVAGDRDDDRGHLGRRHRHGRDRAPGPLDADGAALHLDRLQQLRHRVDRRRRPAAQERPHGRLDRARASASRPARRSCARRPSTCRSHQGISRPRSLKNRPESLGPRRSMTFSIDADALLRRERGVLAAHVGPDPAGRQDREDQAVGCELGGQRPHELVERRFRGPVRDPSAARVLPRSTPGRSRSRPRAGPRPRAGSAGAPGSGGRGRWR